MRRFQVRMTGCAGVGCVIAAVWVALGGRRRAQSLLLRARDDLALELLRVGDALLEQGHTERAVEVYGKALRAGPDSGEVRTVTWPTLLGDTPQVNTAANSVTIVNLYFDGTNYHSFG